MAQRILTSGTQLRAVRAHLPRPARRRRRLRRGDRRRGPRPQHLGRADQQGRLASTTPRVHKGRAATVARQQVDKVRSSEAPRLVVWQGRTSHLAWETTVSGRDHGHPSLQSVYVDAHNGKYLASKEHVAEGTGTGNWEGAVTIPTSGSGSSFSMTNSNATTLRCQNASGNVTFTGTDDVWGNGSRDRPRDRLRRRVLLRGEDAPDDVDLAGSQRHGRRRRLGADPRRPQRRQRLLRRHPGADRSPPEHQRVDRLDGRRRARVRPRGRRPDAGRHLRRRHPGVRGRHLRCRDRVVLQQPGRRSRLPRRRGDQPGRPGPDPQHVQPLGRR